MDQTDVQVRRSDHDHRSSGKSWHACGVAESAKARDCEREGSVESGRNSKRGGLTRIFRCDIPFLPPQVSYFFPIRCPHRRHLTLTTSLELGQDRIAF